LYDLNKNIHINLSTVTVKQIIIITSLL